MQLNETAFDYEDFMYMVQFTYKHVFINLFQNNTVESFKIMGANFPGLWFFLLICGNVISWMRRFFSFSNKD